jgi:membrane protein implicated in regulation of membrane protease activity
VGVSTDDEERGSGWWKPILVALGAAAAAVVAWGWLQPAAEEPREVAPEEGPPEDEALVEELESLASRQPPPWVRPTVLWAISVVVAIVVAALLLKVLLQVVLWILLALFFSFALEPAVNRLARRG